MSAMDERAVTESAPVSGRAGDDRLSGGWRSASGHRGDRPSARHGELPANRQVRNRALLLTSLALAFYFGFIALTLYRSHH
jgi:hypothetical protein